MVLEKTLESPLDKEIKPVNPKRNQPRIFIGRTDTEAETPILWPPDAMSWLTEKTLMLGKIESGRKSGGQRMRWLDGITNVMTWVWVNSGSWWWTGRPGVLQNMGSQGVGHNWVTELSWTELGKIEGRKIRGWQRMRWLDGITDSLDINLNELRETVKGREAWSAAIHGVTKKSDTEQQQLSD